MPRQIFIDLDGRRHVFEVPTFREELREGCRKFVEWPGTPAFAELLAGVMLARQMEAAWPGSTILVVPFALVGLGVAGIVPLDWRTMLARSVTAALGLTLAVLFYVTWLERTGQQAALYVPDWSGPGGTDKRVVPGPDQALKW